MPKESIKHQINDVRACHSNSTVVIGFILVPLSLIEITIKSTGSECNPLQCLTLSPTGGSSKAPHPPSKNNHYAIILHTKHDYIFSDFKDMVIWQLLVKKCEIFFGVLPFSPLK